MTRILVTGSRAWTDVATVEAALLGWLGGHEAPFGPGPVTLVHGGCRGLDRIADTIARARGWTVECHPADWSVGRSAGPARNAEMVAAGADVCIAFPRGASHGTRNCMAAARAAGIPVIDVTAPTGGKQ